MQKSVWPWRGTIVVVASAVRPSSSIIGCRRGHSIRLAFGVSFFFFLYYSLLYSVTRRSVPILGRLCQNKTESEQKMRSSSSLFCLLSFIYCCWCCQDRFPILKYVRADLPIWKKICNTYIGKRYVFKKYMNTITHFTIEFQMVVWPWTWVWLSARIKYLFSARQPNYKLRHY